MLSHNYGATGQRPRTGSGDEVRQPCSVADRIVISNCHPRACYVRLLGIWGGSKLDIGRWWVQIHRVLCSSRYMPPKCKNVLNSYYTSSFVCFDKSNYLNLRRSKQQILVEKFRFIPETARIYFRLAFATSRLPFDRCKTINPKTRIRSKDLTLRGKYATSAEGQR